LDFEIVSDFDIRISDFPPRWIMAIRRPDWELSQRGVKDAARHREKVRESLQKNIADIISDASIITRKKGQIVKVPIRGLKSYRFIYKQESSGGTGIGQGEGQEGDIIARQPIDEGPPGKAGDQPGIDFLETEIDIEELIEMMLKDLGLPNLKQKALTEMAVPRGWRLESIEKKGIISRLDKKRTLKEAVKRTASFVAELMKRIGKPEKVCELALISAKGDLIRAEKILQEGNLPEEDEGGLPLFSEDLRFRTIERDQEYQSNAVVLAMMDVSGSMGTVKKYLARSFFFWLVEFLRQIYNHVQIRFIAHTTEARLVDENEFFHKGESGGTYCHSAYDLAGHLIETEYNPDRWNVYPFHFSDGEDFEPGKTVASAKRLLRMGVNMLGYGEIQTDQYSSSSLMDSFERELDLERQDDRTDDFEVFAGKDSATPFLGVILRDKSHVYLTLREFLRKERPF
jgi:sporulation protein YhbH